MSCMSFTREPANVSSAVNAFALFVMIFSLRLIELPRADYLRQLLLCIHPVLIGIESLFWGVFGAFSGQCDPVLACFWRFLTPTLPPPSHIEGSHGDLV